MRILFDDRPALGCVTGIGRYTLNTVELLRDLPGHEVLVLTDALPECSSAADMELELPALLYRESIDLFHSPLWWLPKVLDCAALVTVHDAIPATHPDLTSSLVVPLWKRAAVDVRRAEGVVCPTAHAREQVVDALALEPERAHVVAQAPAAVFSPRPREAVAAALSALQVNEPYVLCVGTVEPRKNPDGVLDAVASLPHERRPQVLFTGPAGGYDLKTAILRRGLGAWVRSLGYVRDEALACLYTGAQAVLCCSHAEGFGLPAVEAWACGAPVVASNTTALAEVTTGAALQVDPTDPASIAAGLSRVLDSADLRRELAELGRVRLAERYSAEKVRAAFGRLYDELAVEVAR